MEEDRESVSAFRSLDMALLSIIAPGFVETEWQKNKLQEIADAVKFCINNGFVNGSIIEVSGGYCFK